jgi:transposase
LSKKELEKAFFKLKEENERLKEELAYVRFELEELRSKRYKSGRKKPPDDTPGPPQPLPKKKGGLFGHIGWFRKKPKNADKTIELRMDACPECGSKNLSECEKTEEHIQEDIILPRVEVTRYLRHHYYCKGCKKVVSSKGSDELTRGHIGPTAKSLAVFLRYAVKISERDVQALFEKVFNLKIATSSIAGFRSKVKEGALPLYEKLVEALRKGSFIHADETGWKVDGDNHWLWKFSNKKISISHIDPSRGQVVVDKIIGDKYGGILISDFLSAYNKIEAKAKQRCLVHILRDLKKVMEYWHDDAEVMSYCMRLKKILEDGIRLYKEYDGKAWDDGYRRRRKAIRRSIEDFSFPNPNKRILRRFAKRLERHKGEILTFLYEREIDFHNNHAEQQIRPDVIFRKITFGNRSLTGAENHSVITSILQTAKLNKIDPVRALKDILLHPHQQLLLKALSP